MQLVQVGLRAAVEAAHGSQSAVPESGTPASAAQAPVDSGHEPLQHCELELQLPFWGRQLVGAVAHWPFWLQ